MTLARHFAANPVGERLLVLVELSHPTWTDTLRYAEDTDDWTVTLEDDSSATFLATGFDGEAGGINEGGDDSRAFTLPDLDLTLWRRIEALRGYVDPDTQKPVPIRVTIRLYLTSDTSVPQSVVRLALADPERDANRNVSFSAAAADFVNRNAPTEVFTWANSPGLRR